ncbi:Chorismate--pyruvate lyase [Pluralibacter gergoviae]|nr:Chorismate--pyruvate lyase [Pluralibacter gergoviae]
MSHPALAQLRALRYFTTLPQLDARLLDWLLLEDSMTQRFEQQKKRVTVTLLREEWVTGADIESERPLLADEPRYWLREILLCADGEPWLAGRTVVPESTLNGPELALRQLGTTPLGRYLFTSSSPDPGFYRGRPMWRTVGAALPPAPGRQAAAANRTFFTRIAAVLRGSKIWRGV